MLIFGFFATDGNKVPGIYRYGLEIVSLFLVSLFLFTVGLSSQEVIGFDSRFYLFAQEMWRYGISWFPTTYHAPYPDYPATSTLLIYLFAKTVGGLNKWVAVFPSALAAAITVVMAYLIGALQNKRLGLYAVFFLFFTLTFLKSARSISLDMYSVLLTTSCFYCLAAAQSLNKPRLVYAIFPLLLLGFAFRGPIGMVVPTGVVCMYYLLNGKVKKLVTTGLLALVLLILATILLTILAYHVGGQPFLKAVLRMQVMGRMESSFLPPYFYLEDGLIDYALSFPLALLVLIGAFFYAIRSRPYSSSLHFLIQLCGWFLIVLIGMSIPGDKKIRYILPLVPAAALMSAYCFTAPLNQAYFIRLRQMMWVVFLFFPCMLMLAVAWIRHSLLQHALSVPIDFTSLLFMLAGMQLFIWLAVYYFRQQKSYSDTTLLFLATSSFIFTYLNLAEPIELYIDRTRALVLQIEKQRLPAHASLVFYKEHADGLPIKYLINMPHPEPVFFISHTSALMAYPAPAFFVTSESYFNALDPSLAATFQTIKKDTLGHIHVVIFKSNKVSRGDKP